MEGVTEMNMTITRKEAFSDKLKQHGIGTYRNTIEILQINITKKCNQSCIHCHVNAGPTQKEEMSLATIHRILDLLRRNKNIKTVDITGGAPELHPNFRYLISKLRELDVSIIDSCNLTVLLEHGQEGTTAFLAANRVAIVASLPCYTEENVTFQRGNEAYRKSMKVLKQLNDVGYGREGRGLTLHLVYNPLGDYLPGEQKQLEADYKKVLKSEHGIEFNHLYTITNMPINRYADQLKREGKLEGYRNLLRSSYNEKAADKIMCKKQVSVGWNGMLYDCDFNQALHIPILSDRNTIWDIDDFDEISKIIAYDTHCFGCTAGSGSSCQ